MLIALSGTPGTGKSSVSQLLQKAGYDVVDLNDLAESQDAIIGIDADRNSKIIDIDALDAYFQRGNYSEKLVFVEGHNSHLLSSADVVILLRCHPVKLRRRLEQKEWTEKKIKENIDAETLDVILCEATELHSASSLFEIDTTELSVREVFAAIQEIIAGEFRPIQKYKIGMIDWSDELLKDHKR